MNKWMRVVRIVLAVLLAASLLRHKIAAQAERKLLKPVGLTRQLPGSSDPTDQAAVLIRTNGEVFPKPMLAVCSRLNISSWTALILCMI